jgi:hypothetical protein
MKDFETYEDGLMDIKATIQAKHDAENILSWIRLWSRVKPKVHKLPLTTGKKRKDTITTD